MINYFITYVFTLNAFIDATNGDTCKQPSQVPTSSHPAQHDTSGTGLHVSAPASDSDTTDAFNANGFEKLLLRAAALVSAAVGGLDVVSFRFLPMDVVVTGYVVGGVAVAGVGASAKPEPEFSAPDAPTSSVVDELLVVTVDVLGELVVVGAIVAFVVG